MTAGEKYVAAAYLVVFAVLLAYVVIIALKVGRLERELAELVRRARGLGGPVAREPEEEREEARVG